MRRSVRPSILIVFSRGRGSQRGRPGQRQRAGSGSSRSQRGHTAAAAQATARTNVSHTHARPHLRSFHRAPSGRNAQHRARPLQARTPRRGACFFVCCTRCVCGRSFMLAGDATSTSPAPPPRLMQALPPRPVGHGVRARTRRLRCRTAERRRGGRRETCASTASAHAATAATAIAPSIAPPPFRTHVRPHA
jgi:hypothetical protein